MRQYDMNTQQSTPLPVNSRILHVFWREPLRHIHSHGTVLTGVIEEVAAVEIAIPKAAPEVMTSEALELLACIAGFIQVAERQTQRIFGVKREDVVEDVFDALALVQWQCSRDSTA